MESEQLLALALRVEQASADETAALLVEAFDLTNWRSKPRGQIVHHNPQWSRFDKMIRAEAYESAAMGLVPEGYQWTMAASSVGSGATVWPDNRDADRPDLMFAATPALALTASCLRALAALTLQHDGD